MDRTNANTALASAMVEELARCGVSHAVLSPGSRSTPLALALWRDRAIDTRVILDERSAGFVALGAAQATATPTVALCTSGSAAANLHPAVVEADEAGVPLIVLSADRPPELRGIGAGQTIDQLKLYGSAVRWFCELGTHQADDAGLVHFRSVACRAFAAARGEPRPGPVHLNVPWREPLAPVEDGAAVTATSPLALEGRGDAAPLTSVWRPLATPDPPAVAELAERLRRRPRGLLLAGRQADPALAAPVARLAAALGYPLLPEPTSQLRLGHHDRSHAVWAYDAIARTLPGELAPEIVVRFGDMPTSKALRQRLADLEPEQVVIAAHGWNEPTSRATEIVRADPAALAGALTEAVGGGPAAAAGGSGDGAGSGASELGEWTRRWLQAGRIAGEAIEGGLLAESALCEPALHARLARLYGDGDIVYVASSMPIRDHEAFVASTEAEVLFLCNRGANGIDGLISSGAGAAIATGRPTWIVTGELGLVHDAAGLAAVAQASAPVRVVVINNGGGGIFEFLPQAALLGRDEFEALFATPSAVEPERLAAAYGVPYRRLDRLDELANVAGDETAVLVEARTDRRANVELHRRIAARVESALGARSGGSGARA